MSFVIFRGSIPLQLYRKLRSPYRSTFCSGNNTEILAVMPSKLHLFRAQNGVVYGKTPMQMVRLVY